MSASLRDLGRRADALPTTHFDAADLMRQGEARLRRRRLAAAAGAALAVVLAVGLAEAALSGSNRAQVPAQNPSPTQTEWTLERIRAEGTPGDETLTESGITTRAYVVCDGPRSKCENDPPLREPYQHVALEVTQDGRSALFSMGEVLLELDLFDPAPAVPGPGVLVIDHGSEPGGDGFEQVYLVDEREGTLRPLDVPSLTPDPEDIDARHWGPNVDEFLWYVDRDCRVAWATDGTFEDRRLDCAEGYDAPTYIDDDWFPDGWLQPGRMALLERSDNRLFLHVSLNYGNTWQRIPVSDEDAIPDALQRLG